MSASRIAERRDVDPERIRFIRINSDHLNGVEYPIPDFDGSKTCNGWRAVDVAQDNPLQFHRRFMRCLIEYGRKQGEAGKWFSPKTE